MVSAPHDSTQMDFRTSAGVSIPLQELAFEARLHESHRSACLRVSFEGQQYVLKVYHRDIAIPVPGRETDIYLCESVAYRKLLEAGFCDRGAVARFHGSMDEIDPRHMKPHLRKFEKDEVPPGAILLEFVPDLALLDLENFTEDRGSRIRNLMADIHQIGILHSDIQPRHILLQEDSDRILILDFDRAQTFPPNKMNQKWKRAFEREHLLVEDLLVSLASDKQLGHLNKAYTWYYYMVPEQWELRIKGEDVWPLHDPSAALQQAEIGLSRLESSDFATGSSVLPK